MVCYTSVNFTSNATPFLNSVSLIMIPPRVILKMMIIILKYTMPDSYNTAFSSAVG